MKNCKLEFGIYYFRIFLEWSSKKLDKNNNVQLFMRRENTKCKTSKKDRYLSVNFFNNLLQMNLNFNYGNFNDEFC